MKNNVKIIFHIDLNAFFIACELINQPDLKNKPIAIAGKEAIYNKGVVVTASYEARKYGVKAAMPVFQARKLCPHLKFIPSNMELYKEYSRKFISFLMRYTTLVEIASIDEAYLDVTELSKEIHPLKLAKEIQEKLYEEYQLPSSIGIATTKFLAKMASDMKKPLGITVLRNRDIKTKLWPLPIEKMYGIGKKTAPKLIEAGITKIGDLVKEENKTILVKILGNQYSIFYQNALGYGDNIVDPQKNNEYKSIGNSTTFTENIISEEEALIKLQNLTLNVVDRLIDKNYVAKTISVQIKYVDFTSHTKSMTLEHYTDSFSEIMNVVEFLFLELWTKEPIRLLGVITQQLIEKQHYYEQLNLFNYDKYTEEEKVIRLMNDINRKLGKEVLVKGFRLKK